MNNDHFIVENIFTNLQADLDAKLQNMNHQLKQLTSNKHIKHIKKSLSLGNKKWSFLEQEFDQIVSQI